jgi:hypothetical protein
MVELDAAKEFPPSAALQVIKSIGLIGCLYNWLKKPRKVHPLLPPNRERGKGGQRPPWKRKISEKQLETLRKAREAKAAKARDLKAPHQTTEAVSPPITREEIPKRVKKPTPKAKTKPTLIEGRTYNEDVEPTSKTEIFDDFLAEDDVSRCNGENSPY